MTRRIRTVLVGCGDVATQAYLPDLVASPYVDLVGICDLVEARARQAAERFGVARWYTDLAALFEQQPFELLVNTTPPKHHAAVSLAAVQRGRHVFSEKPVATDLAQAAELLRAAQRQGVQLQVAPNTLLNPNLQELQRLIAAGEIGQVHAAYGRYASGGGLDKPVREPWYYGDGGGALFDLGVYLVTVFSGLLGPVRRVSSLSGIVTPQRRSPDGGQPFLVTADDNTMVLLDFGAGCFATIQTGASYGAFAFEPVVEVVGTRGGARLVGWPPQAVEVSNAETDGWERRAASLEGYSWAGGASHLARCLATGEPPRLPAEHAYHVLDVMVSALGSARDGEHKEIGSTFAGPSHTKSG